jgi:outer membrane immunogenic protein
MKTAISTRQVLLASVSALALFIASEAKSADLPVKAPIIAPAPIFSWTGCYVGGHVGFGWGRNHHTQTGSALSSVGSGGTTVVNGAASGAIDTSGGLIGGQVGCNYQYASRWVFGVQGDAAWTDLTGRNQDPLALAFLFPPGFNSISVTTDWLASLTGRIGVTAFNNNQALFYVKGGAAWTHNKWDLTNTFNNTVFFLSPNLADETRVGWTVGVGIEYMFTPHWTIFGEYNYYDFSGDKLLVSNPGAVSPSGVVGLPRTFTSNSQQISTVKVGVNYLFNLGPTPVVAKY